MEASPAVEEPAPTSPFNTIAVRLADEGIPVLAIARATHIPSDQVYDLLRVAILEGVIVEMPKDDWPQGTSRGQRSLVQGTVLDNEEALRTACIRFFKATPLEASILATLIIRDQASKEQLHHVIDNPGRGAHKKMTEQKIVDVMICKLRKKIKPYNIFIETMWGSGYYISKPMRALCTNLLLENLQ